MGLLLSFCVPYYPWLVAIGILIWVKRRSSRDPGFSATLDGWLGGELPRPMRAWLSRLWVGLGFLAVAAVFGWLEYREPYFFSQDDNLSSFFPIMLDACRGAFSGIVPSWNPYQHLGAPTTTYGLYALTYPFLYLSYAIARLCGQEFATLEILAFFHLMGAYFASVAWFRRLRWQDPLVIACAFTVTYSGYQVIAGRSWYYMLPTAVYFPLLLRQLHLLADSSESIGNRWIVQTGLIIGLWFHSGNAQMWTYGILFSTAALAVWWWAKDLATQRLPYAAAAFTIGAGIATPLLLLQAREMAAREFVDTGNFGFNISELFLLPFLRRFLFWDAHGLPFAGGTAFFATAALLLLVHLATRRHLSRRVISGQLYTILALLAAILGAGTDLKLWDLFIAVPPFAKFAVPFKFLGIFAPLCVASGGLFVSRLSQDRGSEAWLPVSAVMFVGLTLWNLPFNHPFFPFADKPYPQLSTALSERIKPGVSPDGRIYSHAEERSRRPGFVLNLSLNFPTAYRIPAFSGYDTTSESYPPFQAAANRVDKRVEELKEYGVRWIITDHRSFAAVDRRIEKTKRLFGNLDALAMTKRLSLGDVNVYEVPGARPLVFDAGTNRALPFTLRPDGVDLESNGAQTIVVNFLNRSWMKARNETGAELPIETDDYGRMKLTLGVASKTIAIRYAPPWRTTIPVGLLVMLFGFLLPGLVKRVNFA